MMVQVWTTEKNSACFFLKTVEYIQNIFMLSLEKKTMKKNNEKNSVIFLKTAGKF